MVQKWKKPLSPDAYSRMGNHDSVVHREEVKEAYTHLLLTVVPEVAKILDQKYENLLQSNYNIGISNLCVDFHEKGVNMR